MQPQSEQGRTLQQLRCKSLQQGKPWQGQGSLQLSCTITTQSLVLCTHRTL